MVTRIDRLARSIGDLQDIVRNLKARGAPLKATEQPIDTGTAAGKCFLDMLGVFAEFETNLRKERQLEGIAKAKANGKYKGRPASIDSAKVHAMKGKRLVKNTRSRRSWASAAHRSIACSKVAIVCDSGCLVRVRFAVALPRSFARFRAALACGTLPHFDHDFR